MGNSIFSLQPTFTQGLLLGQLSILILLALILKYLFLDPSPAPPLETVSYGPHVGKDPTLPHTRYPSRDAAVDLQQGAESAEWFNLLLYHIVEAYRSKLRDDLPGADGDEVARKRIQDFANSIRPSGFLDPIKVLAVDLGGSAPRLSNARLFTNDLHEKTCNAEFDVTYTDSVSVSLSTSVLFNFPMPYFARLPVSLTVSLSVFSSRVILTPPAPNSPTPTLTITVPPTFTLDLKTTSLMGSRAKLADLPKLHEIIQDQVRRVLAERGTWKIALPGLVTVSEVRETLKEEYTEK